MLQKPNEAYPEDDMENREFQSLEQRVIRLEENAWFQDRKLEALDEHARELHTQLDALARQYETLHKAFLHLQEELATAHAGNHWPVDPPPPHWGIEKV